MLAFIDESGDPGFKLREGSSPYFIAAMVVFEDGTKAAEAACAIEESEARKRIQIQQDKLRRTNTLF